MAPSINEKESLEISFIIELEKIMHRVHSSKTTRLGLAVPKYACDRGLSTWVVMSVNKILRFRILILMFHVRWIVSDRRAK